MAKKTTTKVQGYYNGAKTPVQIVFPKLTLEPGAYIRDASGQKINDPYFEVLAEQGRLARELSDVPVPICPAYPEAPTSVLNTDMNGSSVFKEYARWFKQISLDNLRKPDDHPSYPSRLRGDKWVLECLAPRLNSSVPDEVAFLFEVARGSMIYGIFFLPLASLTTEQGFRVLEAGARYRCMQLGLLKKKAAKPDAFPAAQFLKLLAALEEAGWIPEGDVDAWKRTVFLRNSFSHPTSQIIRKRHDAIAQLAYIAELLNRLFTLPSSQTPPKKDLG